jgi:glutamate-ammonia-ligase adenylyltransferase
LRARHGVPRGPDGAPATLAVLGLGKLGGRELGYAADLDVVFVYSGDGETDGPRPLATVELMSRWAQRLMSSLHAVTPRGRLYELDTRLRPSGSKGLLVSSLDGWRQYHAGEARLWERQALIKLRPVAGDPALGRAVAELATAFVWGAPPEAHGGARAIADELRAMRDRIERELGAPGDLKTGAGGVVDVEFAAQLIQLVHGHRHPALRTPSTAAALAAARELALAPPRDLELLDRGYRFLRLVEHRLRVVHDQPVHRLPSAKVELDRLARRTGFPSGAELLDRLDHWRAEIRGAYTRTVDAFV